VGRGGGRGPYRPARRVADFRWTTRESWSRRRRVIAKAEWMPGRGEAGANPRFVRLPSDAPALIVDSQQ
jgi:hypothetical protein